MKSERGERGKERARRREGKKGTRAFREKPNRAEWIERERERLFYGLNSTPQALGNLVIEWVFC